MGIDCRCGKDLSIPEAKAEVKVLHCAGCMGLFTDGWSDRQERSLIHQVMRERIRGLVRFSNGIRFLKYGRRGEPFEGVPPEEAKDLEEGDDKSMIDDDEPRYFEMELDAIEKGR